MLKPMQTIPQLMTMWYLYSIPEPWVAAFAPAVQYELLQILHDTINKERKVKCALITVKARSPLQWAY